ncbi:hypothetical protein HOLleu_37080 [Holothuria leucospilota]|uniref:Uncharacterized protein n=1 Tax=Holothuria leucospilota TaxID=206669 RepID=A0A9Q0YGU3_HOLLE|nr:hypothetical protein HOLleu_37080 [Holothuria leucospilota]
MPAGKSVLFSNITTWIKQGNPNSIDVTISSFDGAEVCELVGLYILNSLSRHCHVSDVGFYRDDGIASLKMRSGRLADRARKNFIKTFREVDLKIIFETNLYGVSFLDVTLNMKDGPTPSTENPLTPPDHSAKSRTTETCQLSPFHRESQGFWHCLTVKMSQPLKL